MIDNVYSNILTVSIPYVFEKGVCGCIENIQEVARVSLVCKSWLEWIYSNEGPFSKVKKRTEIRHEPPLWGPINELNRRLYRIGKTAFTIVKEYGKGKQLDNQLTVQDCVNYVDLDFKSPLQRAIDLVLTDNNKLSLINYLIDNNANLYHSVNDENWEDKAHSSYLVYIFRKGLQDRPETIDLSVRKQVADLFLYKGFSINSLGGDGKGFLHHYIFFKDMNGIILDWYIANGGKLNLKSKEGKTPIQEILSSRFEGKDLITSLSRLVQKGAKVNEPDLNGDYPLHQVLKKDNVNRFDVDLIKTILRLDPSQFYNKDAYGSIPLISAIKTGNVEAQTELFRFMKEHKTTNPMDLQYQCLDSYLNYIKCKVFDRWFDVDQSKNVILQPITFSQKQVINYVNELNKLLEELAWDGQDQFELLLLEDKEKNTFYHRFATFCPDLLHLVTHRSTQMAELCTKTNQSGETIFALQEKGLNTIALIKACDEGSVVDLKLLLNKPLFLDVMDRDKNSLLHLIVNLITCRYSQSKNHYKIIKLLLESGLDPNHLNIRGHTPLYYADSNERLKLLLKFFGGKVK